MQQNRWLVLLGLGLLGISLSQGIVKAREGEQGSPETVATGSSWRSASFPIENFQGYTSPFGYRRSPMGGYGQEFHRGLDLAAPEGSYIRNWWAGRVVEVSGHTNCGTSVVVQSGEWQHVYCHMKGRIERDARGPYLMDHNGGIQVWQGQDVQAGARIGRVGMTGRTTGPHLHWGLKYAGQLVDPAVILRAMHADQSKPQTVSTQPQLN